MNPVDLGPNEHLIGLSNSRSQIDTPALVLDLDVLDANIAAMAQHSRALGYDLRPPAKVHKSIEIARLQVDAGALGPCCATLYEAERMIGAGLPGVMLFTPVVSEPKLARLARLCESTDDLLVVTDSRHNVEQLGLVAKSAGNKLKVLLECEIGAGRTGVLETSEVVVLAEQIAQTPNLEFAGVQGYVGLHQVVPDFDERRALSHTYALRLAEFCAALSDAGLAAQIVTGGGTGTHDIDSRLGVFTELQPGTYVFGDVYYNSVEVREDGTRPFAQSLHVYSTVISTPSPDYVITDAGAKQISGLTGPIPPKLSGGTPGADYSLVGDDMGRIDGAGIRSKLSIGDKVAIIPPLAFQTLTHHQVFHCIRGETLVAIWPISALVHY